MGRELKVHSDAAYDAAHRLAEQTGESVDAVVEQALRAMAQRHAALAPRDARDDSEGAVDGPADLTARSSPRDPENRSADAIIEAARRDIAARRRETTVEGEDIFSEAAIARRRAELNALITWINRGHPSEGSYDHADMYDENGLPI
ncbi:hypothetical protein [Salinarimonas rosea]|uniref:hypothetical protein n=1 Tax=Salinarimonas rosea TaxID=552063 RepID=UPI00040DE496|nr:hypothetical protein [Salinarimonas rosea]